MEQHPTPALSPFLPSFRRSSQQRFNTRPHAWGAVLTLTAMWRSSSYVIHTHLSVDCPFSLPPRPQQYVVHLRGGPLANHVARAVGVDLPKGDDTTRARREGDSEWRGADAMKPASNQWYTPEQRRKQLEKAALIGGEIWRSAGGIHTLRRRPSASITSNQCCLHKLLPLLRCLALIEVELRAVLASRHSASLSLLARAVSSPLGDRHPPLVPRNSPEGPLLGALSNFIP